jgi:hypothetical protein
MISAPMNTTLVAMSTTCLANSSPSSLEILKSQANNQLIGSLTSSLAAEILASRVR